MTFQVIHLRHTKWMMSGPTKNNGLSNVTIRINTVPPSVILPLLLAIYMKEIEVTVSLNLIWHRNLPFAFSFCLGYAEGGASLESSSFLIKFMSLPFRAILKLCTMFLNGADVGRAARRLRWVFK